MSAVVGSRIDARLQRARAGLHRVEPGELAAAVAAGALVVDLRPAADRAAEGELPGAVVVERIHLEWRLDPTSGAALAGVDDDTWIVLVCNEGYASSLAARDLLDLGLRRVSDLAGGYRAWRRAGADRRGWGDDRPRSLPRALRPGGAAPGRPGR